MVVKPASYYQETGVPAIRGTNIYKRMTLQKLYIFQKATEEVLSKSKIYHQDVLIVRSGRPGLAAVVPKTLNGANSIDVLIVSTRKNELVPEF